MFALKSLSFPRTIWFDRLVHSLSRIAIRSILIVLIPRANVKYTQLLRHVTELCETWTVIATSCGRAVPICSLKWCYMSNRISERRHLIARAGGFSGARRRKKKKRTLRHMHGYHETLINCGASPPASRLLCILRAGPRKTTCLSAPANFKMIYRPRKTKFFAVLLVASRRFRKARPTLTTCNCGRRGHDP